MILQPTMKLRWIMKDIPIDEFHGRREKVLQQWWQSMDSEEGEWRDIELITD